MPRAETPSALRPYQFHGLDLEGHPEALTDCPWCGKEGKFSVNAEDGRWRCWSPTCEIGSTGGNIKTFFKALLEESGKLTNGDESLKESRSLLYNQTVHDWGIVKSLTSNEWISPAYGRDSKLVQVYRYTNKALYATTGQGVGLFGINLYEPQKPIIYLCESLWDAMALWEILKITKCSENGKLSLTGSQHSSMLTNINVLATPGCMTFEESWLPYFEDKRVVLMAQSDHPTVSNNGTNGKCAAYEGAKRTAGILSRSSKPPLEITYLKWGERGYDPNLKSGYDARDMLAQGTKPVERIRFLEELLAKINVTPSDWGGGKDKTSTKGYIQGIQTIPCHDWEDLILDWRKAINMNEGLKYAFAVMLAVALSTEQEGKDQLFLQVIGEAGSGKTLLCDGMLASRHCYSLEHMTGFHSGYSDGTGKDFSLINRINGKTCITSEGDTVMSNPKFDEIMGQQRRMFDGSSSSNFKNKEEQNTHTGLRTPWIIAGTPAIMGKNQSHLGDRFLKCCIVKTDEDTKRDTAMQAIHTALASVRKRSSGTASSIIPEKLCIAHGKTSGFIDYLRDDPEELISRVSITDEIPDIFYNLADLTSHLRARPDPDKDKEEKEDCVELPFRLAGQFARLALCLGGVLSERNIDADSIVMKYIRQVALDTCRGRTFDICRLLSREPTGLVTQSLCVMLGMPNTKKDGEDKLEVLLGFMGRVKILDRIDAKMKGLARSSVKWKLSEKMQSLMSSIVFNQ